jgi:lysophospholipase L1-like esterase
MRHNHSRHFGILCGAAALGLAVLAAGNRAIAQFDVVTIGDSWASFIADGAPGNGDLVAQGNAFQNALNGLTPGRIVYNGGFYGDTAGGMTGRLGEITGKINASGADVVYLSAGGNDFLGSWHLNWGPGDEQNLANNVGANVTTIVNHILSINPSIQVFIASYDHVNFWDPDLSGTAGSAGNIVRDNYGLGLQGTPFGILDGQPVHPSVDIGANNELNNALRLQEQGKQNLAAGSRRVHFVDNYGLMDHLNGYNGYFGSAPPGLGQGAYNNLPITKNRLGSGGTDPIHLDTTGYEQVAANAILSGINQAMADNASLALSTTSLDFGTVRIGATPTQGVQASNNGANFSKVQNLTFTAASGDFQGAGQSFNPMFRDPSLGSDTVIKNYTYAPSDHGPDAQNVGVSSSHGGATVSLSGVGVGPEFAASASSIDFGTQTTSTQILAGLDISNLTPDFDFDSLTDLTLISATITGPDADAFSLGGFTPGTVLSKEELMSFVLSFDATSEGEKNATLTFVTDQEAPFGQEGLGFDIPLTGLSAVPEPGSLMLAATAGVFVVFARLRRRAARRSLSGT